MPAVSGRGLPPVSGAWRVGDPVARREFAHLGALTLEIGAITLPEVIVAYETWGAPQRDAHGRISNAVLIEHALTGDAHAAGSAQPGQPTAGWWDALIGPGRALDTDRWFVVCANVLGGCQGTTGPSSLAPDGRPWGSRFPRITVRDQVEVERRLVDHLGIGDLVAIIGGSMGGMRVLEWMITQASRVRGGLVLASSAYSTADQIGTQTAQIMAIQADPFWRSGDYHDAPPGEWPHHGMGVARRIAHLTYRSETELAVRFGREPQSGEDPMRADALTTTWLDARFAVQSYLDHHADKLARRFDPGSYVILTDAMSTHDVGRGRGGVATALAQITAPVVIAGLDSDRLYPFRLQEELASLIPTSGAPRLLRSPYGHDGFLLEFDQVAPLVMELLDQASGTDAAVGTHHTVS